MLAPPAHGVAGRPRVLGRPTGRRGESGEGLECGVAMCAGVARDGSLPLPPLDPYRDGWSEGYEDPPGSVVRSCATFYFYFFSDLRKVFKCMLRRSAPRFA